MRVCIVGFGLIGASLAWQLKAKGHVVVGVARRESTLEAAKSHKLIDESYLEICQLALSVDLVVIALPLELILPALVLVEKFLKGPTVVIDVGSVKSKIVEEAKALKLKKALFVGCHPMAGSDKSGIEHFQTGLFVGKPFLVCYPDLNVRVKTITQIQTFVKEIESRYIEISADEHDREVATISHLPYIVANALFGLYLKDKEKLKQIASTGFFDTTRVAHSDPMWGMMVSMMNDTALIDRIDEFIVALQALRCDILTNDPLALFERLNVDNVDQDPRKMQLVKKWVRDYHTKL
jgi:prephenate dehydrogenase